MYAAMIEHLDRGVGRVMKAVEDAGQMHNTLFVFMSDNGGNAEELAAAKPDDRGLLHANLPDMMPGASDTFQSIGIPWGNCANTPFRLYKHYAHEGGISPWWCTVPGANWQTPDGPGSHIDKQLNHPVVHVSWRDTEAYCRWSGQRLATEAEWEFAARGGLVQKLYPWGDKLRPNGEHRCNIWQGQFPQTDTAEDGYAGTCPVDAFPPNGYGIYSLAGNAWDWCSDWFDPAFHVTGPRIDPQGPPNGVTKMMKGGSFLCHKSYCNRYRVAARLSSTPDSSTSHVSFRCVDPVR
jgi:formylglycine-generating enzyme required for sulfatase activity